MLIALANEELLSVTGTEVDLQQKVFLEASDELHPLPFESKFLPAVLLLLRIYFPQITVTVTVLKFG